MGEIQDWLSGFRALHERYKKRDLTGAEERDYQAAREQLSRSLIGAQGMAVEEGKTARRSFRVSQGLQVDFDFASGRVRAMTLDVSCGGFSVMLAKAPDSKEHPGITLKFPGGLPPLIARVTPGAFVQRAGSVRASFIFQELPADSLERLETLLFDLALARLPK